MEGRQFGRVDFAIRLVHEREVHFGDELYLWGTVGVLFSACDLQRVDAVLECGLPSIRAISFRWREVVNTHMAGTHDRAVPVGHQDIVAVLQPVRT